MILFGADQEVSDWVSKEIFGVTGKFRDCAALGVALQGNLIAGVVYNNMHTRTDGTPYTIEMSVASTDKRWCTRKNLGVFFRYPFIQLKLERIQTHCSAMEPEIIKFNQRLGFTREGLHREAWPAGGDSISWSMLRNECRWLYG